MEGVLAIIFTLGGGTLVTITIVRAIVRSKEVRRQAEVMARLVDKVGSGAEAAQILESPAVRSLFEQAVDRKTLTLQRVLRAVQSGIVLVVLAVALFAIRTQLMDEDTVTGLMVLGTLAAALGIAFLIAAGVSYVLSDRWGLLQERRSDY